MKTASRVLVAGLVTCGVLAAAVAGAQRQLAPPAGERVALVGGTIHTVSGAVIPNGTVEFENGKIVRVGAGPQVDARARVVDCSGKHLYPGFVSANSILGLTEVASVRATNDHQEIGTVNPNIRGEVAINPDSDLLPVARVGGITSALVIPRGGAITGTAALVHLDGWTYEDMTVEAPVGLFVQWPNMSPVTSFNEQRSAEEQRKARDEAIEAIRSSFEEARAYAKARAAEGGAGVPRHDRDVKWDALSKAVRGEIPVLFGATTLAQIRAVLRFVEEQQLGKVILVGGDDAWRVAPEIKAHGIAVILTDFLKVPLRRYEPYDAEFDRAAQLHAAGVKFCIADGGGSDDAMNARNLGQHAAMASAFGLPRDEALKAVTLYPAEILGVAEHVGSIEVGKSADLVVANGDPLETTTRVEQVWIAGRAVSMENRQTRLFEKYDSKPRGPKARAR